MIDTLAEREWSVKRVYNSKLNPALQVSIPFVEFGFLYFNDMPTSHLQEYTATLLYSKYPYIKIVENSRPDWFRYIDGSLMELDFYVPHFKYAIEVQGDQHYNYIPFFHKNERTFRRRLKVDNHKKVLCRYYSIDLKEVYSKNDAKIAVNNLEKFYMHPKSKNLYGKKLNNYKYRMIRRILREIRARWNPSKAIDLIKELNSTLIESKTRPMSFYDIRKFEGEFFQNKEDLFGKLQKRRAINQNLL